MCRASTIRSIRTTIRQDSAILPTQMLVQSLHARNPEGAEVKSNEHLSFHIERGSEVSGFDRYQQAGVVAKQHYSLELCGRSLASVIVLQKPYQFPSEVFFFFGALGTPKAFSRKKAAHKSCRKKAFEILGLYTQLEAALEKPTGPADVGQPYRQRLAEHVHVATSIRVTRVRPLCIDSATSCSRLWCEKLGSSSRAM